mmetsp:Transcript_43692/g.94983  ORF Transcript_43692/g.94983 Transcript_43692/m.94983 type:complete len:177 (+) Transcript_43692:317-847(+)
MRQRPIHSWLGRLTELLEGERPKIPLILTSGSLEFVDTRPMATCCMRLNSPVTGVPLRREESSPLRDPPREDTCDWRYDERYNELCDWRYDELCDWRHEVVCDWRREYSLSRGRNVSEASPSAATSAPDLLVPISSSLSSDTLSSAEKNWPAKEIRLFLRAFRRACRCLRKRSMAM